MLKVTDVIWEHWQKVDVYSSKVKSPQQYWFTGKRERMKKCISIIAEQDNVEYVICDVARVFAWERRKHFGISSASILHKYYEWYGCKEHKF